MSDSEETESCDSEEALCHCVSQKILSCRMSPPGGVHPEPLPNIFSIVRKTSWAGVGPHSESPSVISIRKQFIILKVVGGWWDICQHQF